MKIFLKAAADFVFFSVLALTVVYILSDAVGVFHLSREIGGVVVRLFAVGAPISLVMSVACLFAWGGSRYKWYTAISSVEVGILALVFLIIYSSQI